MRLCICRPNQPVSSGHGRSVAVITLPAFDQYQEPLIPLRGLWNRTPPEGDRLINISVAWLVTTKSTAVQFALGGNSPLAISQIIAVSVDNSRCGADVDFIFPDTGFILTIPAHSQLVAPVFTNSLMFYVSAPGAAAGDLTVAQVLNSQPPPVAIPASALQTTNAVSNVNMAPASTIAPVIAANLSGTLNGFNIVVTQTAAGGSGQIALIDGATPTANILWVANLSLVAGTYQYSQTGMNARFYKGLSFFVGPGAAFTAGQATINLYYKSP